MSAESVAPSTARSGDASVLFVGPGEGPVEAMAEALAARADFDVAFADPGAVSGRVESADCVVCGAPLSDRDAVDLLSSVRSSRPGLPFVLLVAEGSETLASRAISEGVTDYLHAERTSPTTLERRVADAVATYRDERRMRRGFQALETAGEGISILDDGGRFTYLNQAYADTYQYEPEELVGEHWETLYPESDAELVRDEILPAVESEGSWSGMTTGKRRDGTTFPEQHSLAATDDGGLICVVRDVTEQRERVRELRERQRFIRSFHEIVDSTRPFTERLSDLLELGCERFDLDIGFLSNIDRRDGRFTVEAAHGDHEEIQTGAVVDLSQTYCRRVLDVDGPRGVTDAAVDEEWNDHAYERFDLDCYIGTAIHVDNELYGTLCFASRQPRDRSFDAAEETFLELMSEWLRSELARRHRERRIAALNDTLPDLMSAERTAEICERFVDAATTDIGFPECAVACFDGDAGGLTVTATVDESFPASSLVAEDAPGWEAFLGDEPTVVTDVEEADAAEVAIQPLGNHGVVLVGKDGPFTDGERGFLETAASNLTAALDRAERERLLQEREERLERQNESLERLNRINDTIRSIQRGLVSASSREELEDLVCRHLGDRGPYELAWIGEHDPGAGEIVPRTSNGDEAYLETISVPHDGTTPTEGPASEALETLEPVVVEDMLTDRQFQPWRQEALSRGYRSGIVLPLAYEGSAYGVLCLYAGQTDAFDDLERSVLAELSETVAHAINAIESKKGLVDGRVVELEYDVEPRGSDDLIGFAAAAGADLAVESFVPMAADRIRAFVTTRDVDPESFADVTTTTAVAEASLVAKHDGQDGPECLFEVVLTDRSLVARVLEHGGRVRTLTVSEGDGTVQIWLPVSGRVREFADMMTRQYPGSDLRAKRERTRDPDTRGEFRADIQDALTRRQLEVLQTAYFSGFFESPRERTGTEIADSLDVSQPTFNAHLRTAQRKLFTLLFETEGPGAPLS